MLSILDHISDEEEVRKWKREGNENKKTRIIEKKEKKREMRKERRGGRGRGEREGGGKEN